MIPNDLKERIPDYFYIALGGELVSIFGNKVLEPYDGTYNLNSATAGWQAAFVATCEKLNLKWLRDYRKTLTWQEGDLFDEEIENDVIQKFILKKNIANANGYYQYIMKRWVLKHE